MTFLEMDQTFSVPKDGGNRGAIWGIWLTFVVVNGLLALALYALLKDADVLVSIDSKLRGLLIGAGYLGLVRLKFATINDQPFGFEFFFDLAKQSAYTRINKLVADARFSAARKLADERSSADLAVEARLKATYDSLMTEDEKNQVKAWILRVLKDGDTEDIERRLVLADYVLSGAWKPPS
jgi:hypothetical protein